MGQKVHPYGFRLGVIRDWQSRWFSEKEYREFAIEDEKIRKFLRTRLPAMFSGAAKARGGRGGRGPDVGVSRIEVERMANIVKVTLHTARPGLIIGRGGRGIDDLRTELEKLTPRNVQINVMEIRQPELDAQLVAEAISSQIERRVSFKRAIRQGIARTMQRGGKGIKVIVGGRLGGAEIARSYSDRDGKIPLHTLRADIDYGFSEARTQYGNIGVKVWIYRGEILPKAAGEVTAPQRPAVARPIEAAPEITADKKAKGWRRVTRNEATAVAAASAQISSPEEVALDAAQGTGPLQTPVETLEETPVVVSLPNVETTVASAEPQISESLAAPAEETPATGGETEGSEESQA